MAANVFYNKPGTLQITGVSSSLTLQDHENAEFVSIPLSSGSRINLTSPSGPPGPPPPPPTPGRPPIPYIPVNTRNVVRGNLTNFLNDVNVGGKIVLTDNIASDANGFIANVNIRTVTGVVNSSTLIIDRPCTFSTNLGYYNTPAVASFVRVIQKVGLNMMVLRASNAGRDVYFVSNAVNYINFTGGSGYTNTDYVVFSSATAARNGRASITTNSSGGIVSLNIVNTGYGFTSSPSATVYNSSGGPSSGSGATFNVTIGGQLIGEYFGAKTNITKVSSFPVNEFIPNLNFNVRGGTISNSQINFAYYDDASNVYDISTDNFIPIEGGKPTNIFSYSPIVMSRSLEVLNRERLDGLTTRAKSSVIRFTLTTLNNNMYARPKIFESLCSIYGFVNDINNNATNEHLNVGNAITRHISKKIKFDNDRFAEDIRVIVKAYRPQGTDVKIYAKIHNSKDEEAFDDKNWSELEITDVSLSDRQYSSRSNPNDYVELSYGFRAFPPFSNVIDGDAFVYAASGNTTVTGVGTSFNTDLANGDTIVLYDRLFPNTTYGVAVVANTPVATSFEINKAFGNLSLQAATLKVGKVDTPYTAFNDIHNDNVATYYSTSLTEYSTYDTFAIKIVLLSNNTFIVPRVDDVRAIGVSA